MKRVAVGLLCLAVVAGLVGVLSTLVAPSERVYSLDEAQAGLQQHPRAWIGRTILLRGWSNGWGGQGCAVPRPGSRALFAVSQASCRQVWLMMTPTFPYAGPATFSVLLPRGSRVPDDVNLFLGLGMGLHTLPGVGSTLFRWSGSRTLRVRLTANATLCDGPPPCAALVP